MVGSRVRRMLGLLRPLIRTRESILTQIILQHLLVEEPPVAELLVAELLLLHLLDLRLPLLARGAELAVHVVDLLLVHGLDLVAGRYISIISLRYRYRCDIALSLQYRIAFSYRLDPSLYIY